MTLRRAALWGVAGWATGALLLVGACGVRTALPRVEPAEDDATASRDGARDASFDAMPLESMPLDATEESDTAVVADSTLPLCHPLDAGTPGDAGPCVGLRCRVARCEAGSDTVVQGYVYAPNGMLPLYNVLVYVPNATLEPLPRGVVCAGCGALVSGDPSRAPTAIRRVISSSEAFRRGRAF